MEVKTREQDAMRLPDFLIVGAAKSATTSLYFYLQQHPEICMSEIKENWFFSFYENPPDYVSPGKLNNVVYKLNDYIKLYNKCEPGQVLGDASPSYLYTYENTIKNIRRVYPQEALDKLKIIIALREPVSRTFSQYNTFRRKVEEPLGFEDAINQETISNRLEKNWNIFYDYTGFGLYYKQVRAFLDFFGRERVYIVLYDDIRRDPVAVCKTIYDFVGISPDFTPDVGARHNSVTGEPRLRWLVKVLVSQNPVKRAIVACIPTRLKYMIAYFLGKILLRRSAIKQSTRFDLKNFYANDIEQLERLIDRDLSAWK